MKAISKWNTISSTVPK